MPAHDTIYDIVASEWGNRGVPLMPPASEIEVARVFADLGCQLSADVRSLYSVAAGFSDYEYDGLWSFWSLGRIREENSPSRRPFVIFADWLISSHVYCLHYENPQISSIYISHDGWSVDGEPIAGSLAEFLENLLCRPDKVNAWP